MYDDKMVKDVVRLEIVAQIKDPDFLRHVVRKATPRQRTIIKKELKWLENLLRTKAEAVDEA